MRIQEHSRVLQLARRNFDAFWMETVGTLGSGATLVLVKEETLMNPEQFERFT